MVSSRYSTTTQDGVLEVRGATGALATLAPEVFTEGWKKHAPAPGLVVSGFDAVVALGGQGQVGMITKATYGSSVLRFRVTLVPLQTVRVIHIRFVISFPYGDWQGASFRLGGVQGEIPVQAATPNRLAEGHSQSLLLGPSPTLGQLVVSLDAAGLTTVLQDNRQWSPYLQAFMTGGEASDPPWDWTPESPRDFDFTLSFFGQSSAEASR